MNDTVVSAIEQQNKVKGYMDGRSLSVTFSMLRENSLYWNYYVDNYLKGKSPVDFDLYIGTATVPMWRGLVIISSYEIFIWRTN